MGDVDSWYGRVVDVCSWMFNAGTWHRSSRGDTAGCLMRVAFRWVIEVQLDDRWRKLRSVESLDAAGWSSREAEVGWVDDKSMSRFWQYVGLTECVLIWLLAHTASRTWARCCNASAVRNSELLHGLDAALLERRGRSRCWQLGRVESRGLVTKTEPYLSITDQVNRQENVTKVCQALTHLKSSERIGEAKALSCPLAVWAYHLR